MAHPRARRIAIITVGVLALLTLAAVGYAVHVVNRLGDQVDRVPSAFPSESGRPAKSTSGHDGSPTTVLLLGTDRRSEVPTTGSDAEADAWIPGMQRTDTMMLLHVSADRRSASLTSIPRDSWVEVPGHGRSKINAAYSYGGPALAIETVETLTDVRIDHLAVVDWDGYAALIDALGGVEVFVPQTVHDSYHDHTWKQGTHHLDGAQALLYARERAGLPAGDLDRVARQQAVLRALASETLDSLGSASDSYAIVDTLTQHLAVDDEWSTTDMATFAVSLRHLRARDVDYLTAPVRGTGMVGDQSVVFLDPAACDDLWTAIRQDTMDEWAEANPDRLTGGVVR